MKMVQYTRDTGIKPCLLICERRKTMDILILESAGHLAVRKIPLTEQRYMQNMDYTEARALARYRKMARRIGLRNLSGPVRQALSI